MDLDIDEGLRDRIDKRAKRMGFDSAEEYCVVILRTVLNELESQKTEDDTEESQKTEGEVEARLEDLGYL